MLSHVQETFNKPDDGQIIILDNIFALGTQSQSVNEIWKIIANQLSVEPYQIVRKSSKTGESVRNDIKTWLKGKPNRRVICLFDEADNFLEYEANNNFTNIIEIKKLMEQTNRGFKAVFAGLHQVQRMYKTFNTPLAHFGKAICIGPLNNSLDDREAAYKLVVEPLRAAGFRFEEKRSPYEILSYVNHYPSLVQLYLRGFLWQMYSITKNDKNGPLWKIPNKILFSWKNFESIESEIREKFMSTLDLDTRYNLIANVMGLLRIEPKKFRVHQSRCRC